LPTNVGFAPTKSLAKLAKHVAKTSERKPGSFLPGLAGVCHFGAMSAALLSEVMQRTDVGNVWGVGRKTSARMHEGGIRSVQDLVCADTSTLRRQFNVLLEKTIVELRGTHCLEVDDAPEPNQQIMCSRSFGEPVTDLASLGEVISLFATRVAEKLRGQHSDAAAVHVFIKTSPFRAQDRQHSPSITLPLVRATSDTQELVAGAVRALEDLPARLQLRHGGRDGGGPATRGASAARAQPVRRLARSRRAPAPLARSADERA
jgi:DNA polymerase V